MGNRFNILVDLDETLLKTYEDQDSSPKARAERLNRYRQFLNKKPYISVGKEYFYGTLFCVVRPSGESFLRELKQKGYNLFVFTSAKRIPYEGLLKESGLWIYFNGSYFRHDIYYREESVDLGEFVVVDNSNAAAVNKLMDLLYPEKLNWDLHNNQEERDKKVEELRKRIINCESWDGFEEKEPLTELIPIIEEFFKLK